MQNKILYEGSSWMLLLLLNMRHAVVDWQIFSTFGLAWQQLVLKQNFASEADLANVAGPQA